MGTYMYDFGILCRIEYYAQSHLAVNTEEIDILQT
jgi:hypothetical protein